jgi:hypothetical protein
LVAVAAADHIADAVTVARRGLSVPISSQPEYWLHRMCFADKGFDGTLGARYEGTRHKAAACGSIGATR